MARTVRDAAIMLRRDGRARPEGFDLGAAAGAGLRGGADRRHPRPARSASRKEYRVDGMPAEIEALWQQGVEWLRDAGAEPVEISLPITKYALPAYYIIAPAEASSNLARYDGVRFGLRVAGRQPRRDVRTDPRRRLRRRGAPPRADRHLCAVGRLLRRLLPEGAEGAHPDRARFRRRLRAGRLHPDPDRAVGRLRDRREDRRSDRDVSERRLHRAGESRRAAGDLGAGRALGRRPAARAAGHRPRLRRGDRAARRRGHRKRRLDSDICRVSRRRHDDHDRRIRTIRMAASRMRRQRETNLAMPCDDRGPHRPVGNRDRPRGPCPGDLEGQAVLRAPRPSSAPSRTPRSRRSTPRFPACCR